MLDGMAPSRRPPGRPAAVPRRVRRAAALAFALVAAGCTGIPVVCPTATVADQTAKVAKFGPGPSRDASNLWFTAEITQMDVACEYVQAAEPGSAATARKYERMEVNLRLEIVASRAPSAQSRVGEFEYFVAVADPAGNILAKETFPLRVEFRGDATRVRAVEEIWQRYTLEGRPTRYFNIWMGFQLTPEEIEYNRRIAGG